MKRRPRRRIRVRTTWVRVYLMGSLGGLLQNVVDLFVLHEGSPLNRFRRLS